MLKSFLRAIAATAPQPSTPGGFWQGKDPIRDLLDRPIWLCEQEEGRQGGLTGTCRGWAVSDQDCALAQGSGNREEGRQ